MRENAPWYQHEEVGCNYRMSNVIAGVVRGQYPYLEEHIAQPERKTGSSERVARLEWRSPAADDTAAMPPVCV